MRDKDDYPSGLFRGAMAMLPLTVFLCFVASIGTCNMGEQSGYKRGQIDAARGIQHFHLTTQSSVETLWVETKEGK